MTSMTSMTARECDLCGGAWNPVTGFRLGRRCVCPDCMSLSLRGELGQIVPNTRKAGQGSKWIRQEKRWAFYARDGWRCLYCTTRAADGATLSLDHFRPVSKEATDADRAKSATPDNIVTLCVPCNSARQDVPTAIFIRRLEEKGLDPAPIAKRVARHRARKFSPVIISPYRPRKVHLEVRMTPVDWAATVSRLLEAVQDAAKQAPGSAAAMNATAAAALEVTIRSTGAGAVEGARAALLARRQSAATGLDVGLAVASKLLAESPDMLKQERWIEDYRSQRERELAGLLASLSD